MKLSILYILLLVIPFAGCRSIKSSSESHTRAWSSSSLSELKHTMLSDTASTTHVTFSNGYMFVKETQTITEYDTSKPGNPVAKKTETQKHTVQGSQAQTDTRQQSGKQTATATQKSGNHQSGVTVDESASKNTRPVLHTTVMWYVIGGIVVAIVGCVTAVLTRRKKKRRNSE